MPYYDLSCKNCGNEFNVKATIAQRENNEIECPQCKSKNLEAVFKSLNFVIKSNNSEMPSCPQAHRCGANCCHARHN